MAISAEKKAAFEKHIAGLRAKRGAKLHETAGEAGDAPVAIWQARDGAMLVLHPTTYTDEGDKWQVTRFISGEIPAGHDLFKKREDGIKAIMEMKHILGEYRVVHRGAKKNPKRSMK